METEMKTYIGETVCPLHSTILYVAIGIPEEDSCVCQAQHASQKARDSSLV